jgi:phosphohistidine phosphatase SixA
VIERRLYLLRHAKSSWKDERLADHDRPLAGRGKRAAKAIAGHLRKQGIEPELVLCSTATRARETLAGIRAVLGDGEVRLERELYRAGPGVLLARLHAGPEAVGSVMVIGHNPGTGGPGAVPRAPWFHGPRARGEVPDGRTRHARAAGLRLGRARSRLRGPDRVRPTARPRAVNSARRSPRRGVR